MTSTEAKPHVSPFAATVVVIALFFGLRPPGAVPLTNPQAIPRIVTVDPAASPYGTFQSHNQKVVSNRYGIFMTYAHYENPPQGGAIGPVTWRLARSVDGGLTFGTIFEHTSSTRPPILETDENGVVYLLYSRINEDGNAYLVAFSPANGFSSPLQLATLVGGASGKMAMVYDPPRRQIYYFVGFTNDDSPNNFYIIKLGGLPVAVVRLQLTKGGPFGTPHYPLLYLDTTGDLYAAWTTTPYPAPPAVPGGNYPYRGIHFMKSRDGGMRWEKLDGTLLLTYAWCGVCGGVPVWGPPVIGDDSGPTDRLILDDEVDTRAWLWTVLAKQGKLHFAYHAEPPGPLRQHYVRYDLPSAAKDHDVYPAWTGETLTMGPNFDGFCATTSSRADGLIYCVSQAGNQLVSLVSYDNGTTWRDLAHGPFIGETLYAIGGAREVTPEGYVIGSYTDQSTSSVKFFRIRGVNRAALGTDLNRDGKADLLCRESSTGTNRVATSSGPSSFAAGEPWNVNGMPWCFGGDRLLTGDFNGDGWDDLACHQADGDTYVAVNAGTGAFSGGDIWGVNGAPWCSGADVGVGDFNGDGKTDLYCYEGPQAKTSVALSSGTHGFTGGTVWNTNGQPWCYDSQLGVGDFNGDGKSDLFCHESNGSTSVAASNGISGFTLGTVWKPNWCVDQLGVGDFDGDGRSDLYCHVGFTGRTSIALSNGASGFGAGVDWPTNGQPWCYQPLTGVGDVDGDRVSDLVCHTPNGRSYVALSNGVNGFTNGTNWKSWCEEGEVSISW